MKTVRIKLYKFSELVDKYKKIAAENYYTAFIGDIEENIDWEGITDSLNEDEEFIFTIRGNIANL
jgi:hypothetical protein